MIEQLRWKWKIAGVAIVVLAAIGYLTSCMSTKTASVTPTPTKTPCSVSTEVAQVPTYTARPRPSPTLTAADRSVTNVTNTPTMTPEPTETLAPTSTPLPTLAADVCPLTGLQVSDPALLERRPLAIKVQNAAISRPQYGLPQADIVYEHLTEAAITRFTAIYLCQPVTKVGSTRSARFIDLEIPAMYKSLMAFSGTSSGLYPKFLNADFYDREFCFGWGLHDEGFYRDRELLSQGVPLEHTLFADPIKIWQIADQLGINQRQDLQGLTFDYQMPDGGVPATDIHIPFPSRDMVVDYTYDESSGVYLRSDAGDPHMDAASGQQISVTNVVVLYATHVDADFYEDEPRRNHPSVQIQLWGTGPAVLFRDGQAIEGLWARPKRDEMVVLRDKTGQIPIALKPGNTWFELVPLPGHRWSFEASWDAGEQEAAGEQQPGAAATPTRIPPNRR
jgi:hypothetical protein